MSHLQQHCQMIQNYLNVEMEITWKKMVIPGFFYIHIKMNKIIKILSHWHCVWTDNETQYLQNNKQECWLINNIIQWYTTNKCETKYISLNTLCWCYRNVTYVPSCCVDRQTVCENLHSANWTTFHPEAWRCGLGSYLCSPSWPRLLPWSREIWPWEVQWWEQTKHQKLHIPAIWIRSKKLHW